MTKFENKVKEIALAVGGSHYPSVNPHLHELMVKTVVSECINAVEECNKAHVYTTFDDAQFETTLEKVKQSINERFGL